MSDLWLDQTGDICVGSDGDLKLASGADETVQTCAFRLKTEPGELVLAPTIGVGLSRLIGTRLVPETLQAGEQLIEDALTFDEAVDSAHLTVRGVPMDPDSALFVIEIYDDTLQREVALTVPFDWAYGINAAGIRSAGSFSAYTE